MIGHVLGEVLGEHVHQLLRLTVIGRTVCPGLAWVQKPVIDIVAGHRHLEAEMRILAELPQR
jgi:hypothetical protein